MPEAAGTSSHTNTADLIPAFEVARRTSVTEAANGIRYGAFAETGVAAADLLRLVQAVPAAVAAALVDFVYYFVPLAMAEGRDSRRGVERAGGAEAGGGAGDGGGASAADTLIAPAFSVELAEFAICHRTAALDGALGERPAEGVFISTRLLSDRFSLAFELYINVAHAFVEIAGVPAGFGELVWGQAIADVRGETSQDAWEHRAAALGPRHAGGGTNEGAKTAYLQAAFSDAVAIYLLSLATDFDYAELREREYPLLAAQPLAARLRHVNGLFPPNAGYEFAVRYRRRG